MRISRVGALVEEEFRTRVVSDRTPFGGVGETSSPVDQSIAQLANTGL
jgi:hypothetical protein